MSPPLWTPPADRVRAANLTRFAAGFAPHAAGYAGLHRESLDRRGEFWRAVWAFAGILGDPGDVEYVPGPRMTDARWFPGGRLNFAENLLRGDGLAIIACSETGPVRTLAWADLRDRATGFAAYLRSVGVRPGDRVAALLSNVPEAVVAMLGTTLVGAVWSCCSPDFGVDAICDRFGQIEPVVFVSQREAIYAGKRVDVAAKADAVAARLPTVRTRVPADALPRLDADVPAERFPFDHPAFVLYSSGTTGPPKCIVHGAGGTLLQHVKEHQLHTDVRPGDRVFFYTTTGWMMWNWLASALASRATVVLYDGSPLHPDPLALWRLAAEHRVTQFGAGAKLYAALEKAGVVPRAAGDLSALRCVLSTGSPLLPESFDYVYRDVKADVQLASISGGTDIVSCFVLGNPTAPVYRGEVQAKGLGMDVAVFDAGGKPVVGEPGELVCRSPFPSMPVGFWNDPGGAKYRAAYFEAFDYVWTHGDWAEETPAGGFVIHGRSDATLNPGGVRIGTAEIYQQVEAFPDVAESLAVALRRDGDERIVLFVRMKPGCGLTPGLADDIKRRLRERCSPRHVPAFVLAAPDLPRTVSGKLSELAVRNAIHGRPVKNAAALANPEALEFFATIPELQ